MSNFKDLLAKPAETFEAPKPLPVGTYTALIAGHTFGESRQKKTPFVEFTFRPMSAHPDVDPQALADYGSVLKEMKMQFYLTEEAVFRIRTLAEKLGINIKLSLAEVIENCVNKMVNISVSHTQSQDGKSIYANISDVIGPA